MELSRTRALILRHGWNATAYQLLNPGIDYWFSSDGDGVIGYVSRRGVRVVAGAPVCAEERLRESAVAFEADAARAGERVCYFGADPRLVRRLGELPTHSVAVLGAQPTWHPASWSKIVASHATLRAQLNRARNKGVVVAPWPAERAADHPELVRCLTEWLAARGLPSLHFLVEPETLGRIFDRRICVAERDGRPVGFLVASPVPARGGWLVEQIIRGREAPNGTAELLIDAAIRGMAHARDEWVTLGLAPLSHHAEHDASRNPLWLRAIFGWVRAHGRRFYNFEGLDRFKSKFRPDDWEPVFAIANEPRFTAGTLYAIAAAFSGGSPAGLIARALARSVKQELGGPRWRRA